MIDVGYFLVSSLHADTEEAAVDELLAGYHAELVMKGVTDYPYDQFHADYLDGLLIILHRLTGHLREPQPRPVTPIGDCLVVATTI